MHAGGRGRPGRTHGFGVQIPVGQGFSALPAGKPLCKGRAVADDDWYPPPEEYVTVACLTNDHVSCLGSLRCACLCHQNGSGKDHEFGKEPGLHLD